MALTDNLGRLCANLGVGIGKQFYEAGRGTIHNWQSLRITEMRYNLPETPNRVNASELIRILPRDFNQRLDRICPALSQLELRLLPNTHVGMSQQFCELRD